MTISRVNVHFEGMINMNVSVMSRTEAIRYCKSSHENRVIMVSISDPYIQYFSEPFCSKENKVVAIQKLFFSDADKVGEDVYGRVADQQDLFSDSDAELVKRLLNKFPDTDVIVHCDAGISRSSGVAAGILKAITGSDLEIFNNPKYKPNMRCYRLMLNALVE